MIIYQLAPYNQGETQSGSNNVKIPLKKIKSQMVIKSR